MALVTSGNRGAGVTSLAVNVSVALAEQGHRVVFVDADMDGAGAGELCGLPRHAAYADLNTARRDIHEVLQRGPAGLQVVPRLRLDANEPHVRPLAIDNLLRQLMKLGQHADQVVVDAGHAVNDLVRRLTESVDDILVVVTPEQASITDAYAHIKRTLANRLDKLRLIVNMSDGDDQARDVARRFSQSCERFLSQGIEVWSHVPRDASVPSAARSATPFVLMESSGAASRAVQRIAAELAGRQARQVAA
jgi:flagellar biosynthesis protein FlhG